MSLCLAHTMPKTGAAGFLQPGTGQSCLGAFLRARPPANARVLTLAPRALPWPSAPTTAARAIERFAFDQAGELIGESGNERRNVHRCALYALSGPCAPLKSKGRQD